MSPKLVKLSLDPATNYLPDVLRLVGPLGRHLLHIKLTFHPPNHFPHSLSGVRWRSSSASARALALAGPWWFPRSAASVPNTSTLTVQSSLGRRVANTYVHISATYLGSRALFKTGQVNLSSRHGSKKEVIIVMISMALTVTPHTQKLHKSPAPSTEKYKPAWMVKESRPVKRCLYPSTAEPDAKKCRFTTIYDEMLRPLSPATVLPVETTWKMRVPGTVNSTLQKEFLGLVADGSSDKLGKFLSANSENICINQYSQDGFTPLQRVCQDAEDGALALARVLIQHGANPKLTSRDGFSPVHMASFSGNTPLLLFLLKCSAK